MRLPGFLHHLARSLSLLAALASFSVADEGQRVAKCDLATELKRIIEEKGIDRKTFEVVAQDRPEARGHSTGTDSRGVQFGEEVETGSVLGSRRVIRKIDGQPWNSYLEPQKNAIQGDPRAFIFAAGSIDVGKFFGFELQGSEVLIAPGATRLNSAIDSINAVSPRLKLQFKFETAKGKITDYEFLDGFSRRGRFPLAEADETLIHDLSYHSGINFLPNEEIGHAMRQRAALLDFVDYVRGHDPNLLKNSKMAAGFESAISTAATSADNVTGNMVMRLARGHEKEIPDLARQLTRYGISPRDYVLEILTPLDAVSSNPKIQQLWKEFRDAQAAHPEFNQRLAYTQDKDFLERLSRKRLRIEAAVRLKKTP